MFLFIVLIGVLGYRMLPLFFPKKEAPPEARFGSLPAIPFPKNNQNSFTYSIETVTGKLPQLPTRATVYMMQKPQPNLLALSRAKERMIASGFSDTSIAFSDSVYEWMSEKNPTKKIRYDILSFNFDLTSDFLNDTTIQEAKNLGDEPDAISTSIDFLTSLGSLPTDIDEAKTKTTLLTIQNAQLRTAPSISTTQLIRVDLFQKDTNNLPIVYPTPTESTMHFLIGSDTFGQQIVFSHFFHQAISQESSEYPLISVEKAYEKLQKANCYIASTIESGTSIQIKNVYLAYYTGDTSQDYLYPVFVFEGTNEFVGYVSAISDEFIQ